MARSTPRAFRTSFLQQERQPSFRTFGESPDAYVPITLLDGGGGEVPIGLAAAGVSKAAPGRRTGVAAPRNSNLFKPARYDTHLERFSHKPLGDLTDCVSLHKDPTAQKSPIPCLVLAPQCSHALARAPSPLLEEGNRKATGDPRTIGLVCTDTYFRKMTTRSP